MAAALLVLCAVINPVFGKPVTLACEYKEGNSKPSRRSFVWDAQAGLFDGHRIGEVWHDGPDRLELRKTEISVIQETFKQENDGHKTKISISIDDYGYFTKMENDKVIAKGDCKKAVDEGGLTLQK